MRMPRSLPSPNPIFLHSRYRWFVRRQRTTDRPQKQTRLRTTSFDVLHKITLWNGKIVTRRRIKRIGKAWPVWPRIISIKHVNKLSWWKMPIDWHVNSYLRNDCLSFDRRIDLIFTSCTLMKPWVYSNGSNRNSTKATDEPRPYPSKLLPDTARVRSTAEAVEKYDPSFWRIFARRNISKTSVAIQFERSQLQSLWSRFPPALDTPSKIKVPFSCN